MLSRWWRSWRQFVSLRSRIWHGLCYWRLWRGLIDKFICLFKFITWVDAFNAASMRTEEAVCLLQDAIVLATAIACLLLDLKWRSLRCLVISTAVLSTMSFISRLCLNRRLLIQVRFTLLRRLIVNASIQFECFDQIGTFEEELYVKVFISLLALFRCIHILPFIYWLHSHSSPITTFSHDLALRDSLMASLLLQKRHSAILPPFITDVLSVVAHSLDHLFKLLVVVLHGLLTTLIGIPDLWETAENGFSLLHLFLALRPLSSLAHGPLFLHVLQLFVQCACLIQWVS